MLDDKIVCRCNIITIGDMKKFMNVYPDMDEYQLKNILKIGSRCGGCQKKDCSYIDVHFKDAIEIIK